LNFPHWNSSINAGLQQIPVNHSARSNGHVIAYDLEREDHRASADQHALTRFDMTTQSRVWRDVGKGTHLDIMVNNSAMVDDHAGPDAGGWSNDGASGDKTAAPDGSERRYCGGGMNDRGQPVMPPETGLLLTGKVVPDGNVHCNAFRSRGIDRSQRDTW
jgi:hypothetical protein